MERKNVSKWSLKFLLIVVFILLFFSQMVVFEMGILDGNSFVLKNTKRENLLQYLYFEDSKPQARWQQFQLWIDEVKYSNPDLYKEFISVNFSGNILNKVFSSETFAKLNISERNQIKGYKSDIELEYERNLHKLRKLIEKLENESVKWNENKLPVDTIGVVKTTPTNLKIVPVSSTVPPDSVRKGTTKIPTCVVNQKALRGRETVNRDYHGYRYLENLFSDTETGGRWRPKDCVPSKRVAIILPFRDRDAHLKQLLHNLIPKLQRQKVDYTFYLVEQGHGSHFNRGMMRNVGFTEASKDADYDCYIFNDVDTVIEDDHNIYTCDDHAANHMGGSIDIFNYTLPYNGLIGGILSFPGKLFRRINGYSNFYFMWGAEDDDMWRRIHRVKGGRVIRPPRNVTYITTLKHERDPKVWERVTMFLTVEPFVRKDGLNTLEYQVVFKEKRKLFTWLYVKVNETHYHELLEKYKLERKKEKEKEERLKALSTTTAKNLAQQTILRGYKKITQAPAKEENANPKKAKDEHEKKLNPTAKSQADKKNKETEKKS